MKCQKLLTAVVLLIGGLTLQACSPPSSPGPAGINGTWNATLYSSDNVIYLQFGSSINVPNNDGSIEVEGFTVTTSSACFASAEGETGIFTNGGTSGGNVIGSLEMSITAESPSGNALSLAGSVNGTTISGTWALSGTANCNLSGNFTMTRS